MRAARLVALAVCLGVPVCHGTAWGRAGDLDTTFGQNGIAFGTEPHSGEDVLRLAATPDRGVLVAGANGKVARYTSDGDLDVRFGSDGRTSLGGAFIRRPKAVTVQPDGRTVLVGWSAAPARLHVVRLTELGQPDALFGVDGIAQDPFHFSEVTTIAVDSERRIVIAGRAPDQTGTSGGSGDPVLTVVRLSEAGARDSAFGNDGVTQVPSTWPIVPTALGFASDGGVLVAGVAVQSTSPKYPVVLLRLAGDGRVDSSFGNGGQVFDVFGAGPTAGATSNSPSLLVQPDGKIVVSGVGSTTACCLGEPCATCSIDFASFALARFGVDGRPDGDFGTGGIALAAFPWDDPVEGTRLVHALPFGIARQADGKLVVAGAILLRAPEFGVARFTSAGVPDRTFGRDGTTITEIPTIIKDGVAYDDAVALLPIPQPDGSLFAAGLESAYGLAVTRYEGDRCGNGAPEDGEACDDGNRAPDDGCEPDCSNTVSTTSTTTSTTIVFPTTSTTTTTTLPCTAVTCRLSSLLLLPECEGSSFPDSVRDDLTRAADKLELAPAAPARKARKLLNQARKLVNHVGRYARHASRKRAPRVSAACSSAIGEAIEELFPSSEDR